MRARVQWAGVVAILCLLAGMRPRPAAAADYYILKTEEARTVGDGNLKTEVEVGVTKQDDASELYNIPRMRAEYGLSEWVDLEFEYEALAVEGSDVTRYDRSVPTTSFNRDDVGTGDLRIRLKMVPFDTAYGTFGYQLETKLPNADQDRGLGSNSTDVTGRVLHTLDWSQFTDTPILRDITTHTNVGLSFQGDPARNGNSNELFIFGVAAEYPLTERLTLMGEIEGAYDTERALNVSQGPLGTDRVVGRLAMTGPLGEDWRWGVSAAKGLSAGAPDWEVQFGLSRLWGLHYKREQPRHASPEMRWIDPEAVNQYYNPLWTEEAQVMGPGRSRAEVEFGYMEQADGSDLYTVPRVTWGWGLGEWVDFEVAYEILAVEDANAIDRSSGRVVLMNEDGAGSGDLRLHLKMVPWRLRYGDLGLLFTTKVPLADEGAALGTDEADFTARLLLSSNWGSISSNAFVSRLTTHVNVGMSIQEDPFSVTTQNDLFVWGAAAEYALWHDYTAWLEVHGAVEGDEVGGIAEGTYGDKQLVARAGLTGPTPDLALLPDWDLFHDWRWSLTGFTGLTNESPDYGAQLGLSHTWGRR